MKKVIALFLVLGLFAAAPVMAAEDSILAGVSQSEVISLANDEMSQIQGEGGLVTLLNVNLNLNVSTSEEVLGLAGALLGAVLGLAGGLL
ncbi:MAG: hypothetical protein ACU843_14865 [Gammaproteobacteria bacterium]